MRRVLATLGWVLGAAAVVALFVAAGRWSTTPVRSGDLRGWLDDVPPEEALVELARWVGLAIAGYVAVVSLLVLLSELAAAARWVSLAKLLRRVGLGSAIPALRRRLVHATATTAITVSSLAATGASIGATAPSAVEQVVDVAPQLAPLPDGVTPEQVSGFGVSATPGVATLTADQMVVAPGDTLWDLTVARFGFADAPLIGEIARLSGVSDPSLIYVGQVITFPAQPPTAVIPPPPPSAPQGAASWGVHRIVYGDTLWDILQAHYGYVDADLVWFVAEHNGLTDPSDIPIGADVWLPPLPGNTPAPSSSDVVVEPVTDPVPVSVPAVLPPPVAPMDPSVSVPVQSPNADLASPEPTANIGPPATPAESTAVPRSAPALSLVPSLSADHVGGAGAESPGTAVLPWVLAGGGSVVLTTGLVEWFRRRRRARWSLRGSAWRVGAASEEPAAPELADGADLGLVEWAAASLGRVVHTTDDAAVVSVELDEATLSVRWDRQRSVASSPWWSGDDGWVWNLSRSAWLPPHEDDPVVAVPGLVTFGERSGRQYLVNLGAAGTVAVDGPLADEFVASLVLELATGDVLSNAAVRLVNLQLVGGEQLQRVAVVSSDSAASDAGLDGDDVGFVLWVVEGDDPAAPQLVQQATPGSGHGVVVLGRSSLPSGVEITLSRTGTGQQSPAGVTFTASRAPDALISIQSPVQRPAVPPAATGEVTPVADEPADRPLMNVVALDDRRRDPLEAPRLLLRLFSARLPVLEPTPPGLDARQMRIVAVLDSFGAGRPPARLAERLRVSEKTVRNQVSPLFALDPPIVHSDGDIWTLDSGVCSDVEWMHDLATSAREAPSRQAANRALNECWELFSRVTGPAYAGGAESRQWEWVNEREDGTTPVEMATRELVEAVTIAAETWDKLAIDGDADLRSASSIVQVMLRLEQALGMAEPWRLLGAAVKIARRGPDSARQQIAMRLAQLAHDGDLQVPESLVAEVVS